MTQFIDDTKAWAAAHPKATACIACTLLGFVLALAVLK